MTHVSPEWKEYVLQNKKQVMIKKIDKKGCKEIVAFLAH
jgi:hypothetical protein